MTTRTYRIEYVARNGLPKVIAGKGRGAAFNLAHYTEFVLSPRGRVRVFDEVTGEEIARPEEGWNHA